MNGVDCVNQLNHLESMTNLIKKTNKGSIFVASDFADIANNEVVRKNLSILTKRKILKRINHGLYLYPQYSKLTNEILPFDINEATNALARNYGWTIVPFGQTALNILGLSNQIPVTYEYLSDGPYRKYTIEGYQINFLHRTNKDLSSLPYKTALFISAIKALGQDRIADDEISILKGKLTPLEKKRLLNDTKYITKWIREVLEKVIQ